MHQASKNSLFLPYTKGQKPIYSTCQNTLQLVNVYQCLNNVINHAIDPEKHTTAASTPLVVHFLTERFERKPHFQRREVRDRAQQ